MHTPSTHREPTKTKKSVEELASAHLETMPVSVSGQDGHRAAFTAAVALVRGFNLSEQAALPILAHWNRDCQPPWSESELRYKLRSAATNGTSAPGFLLAKYAAELSAASATDRTAPDFENEDERRARQRKAWPQFTELTQEDIATIARLRRISPDAVDLAQRHGFLKGVTVQGQRCFALVEGTFAQARRLDGKPLQKADGTALKARNFQGSQGAFIGQSWLQGTTHVLLVEGAIGLLEGLAAMLLVDTEHAWSVLAATSASSRFARDPALLERLKGKTVRIVRDEDEAGINASGSWLADLEAHGISAQVIRLPGGSKDLGDFLKSDDPQPTLDRIFETRKKA
ncbi:toprim domain-containing protein [Prosthecobacter sp.]|uniref:toprim domain-containing protein n=1 Tax=Prosthecobacter sp. TaxID=1965333 RepID=UPI003783672C